MSDDVTLPGDPDAGSPLLLEWSAGSHVLVAGLFDNGGHVLRQPHRYNDTVRVMMTSLDVDDVTR